MRTGASIIEQLRALTERGGGQEHTLITGTVVTGSVDVGGGTCTVLPTFANDDSSLVLEGVLLSAITDSDEGVIVYPKDGSSCIIAQLDGGGEWVLLVCDTIEKVTVKVGDVAADLQDGKVHIKQAAAELTIQGGKYQLKNGATDLKTVLNGILSHIQALTVPTGTGPSGVPINTADFVADNSKVNQLFF
ncbi:MAG: hypothetical protein EBZ77_16655 [Chitinophagia bacterium]|nr:hypothetical protein [Chitinophagia bacterium]